MRFTARIWIVGAAAAAVMALCAPIAQAAFGVEEHNFEAGTCEKSSCTYASIEKELAKTGHSEAYTQAAGHPPFGITGFELNHKEEPFNEEPEGALKRLRVDVPPGPRGRPGGSPELPGR